MRKFIPLLYFLTVFNQALFAQADCKCNEYNYVSNGNEADSVIASKLMRSPVNICRAKGYELIGTYMSNANELDSAEFFLQKAEKLYLQTNCSDSILLLTYESWAQIYYTRADFAKAQEYSLKSLRCAESAGNIYKQANCNTMVAQLFNQTNQAEKGIIYTRRAVLLLDKITSLSKRMILYLNSQKDTSGITRIQKQNQASTVLNFSV